MTSWMRGTLAVTVVLLLGQGCDGRSDAMDTDGGEGDAAGPYDGGPGMDGGDPADGGGPGSDGDTPDDGGGRMDGGWSDGGSADGGLTCDPSGSSEAVDAYCDSLELAVIDDGTGAQDARLTGRVRPDGLSNGDCAVVDEVEVREGGTTIGTMAGAGAFEAGNDEAVLAREPALPAMTSRCSGDTERFGGFGFIIRGRKEGGGSFEARCVDAEPGSGWPPHLRITCHENVDQPASQGSARVESFSGSSFSSIDVTVPHGPGGAIESADPTVHIIPHADPWSGAIVPEPYDVTGLDTSVSEGSSPLWGTYSSIHFSKSGDIFGTDLCPSSDSSDGGFTSYPVMIVRLTGTSERGAYMTEAYVPMCSRISR